MTKRQSIDFNKLIPNSLKNENLTSLVSNLFNKFVSTENSVIVNGRVGKQVAGDATIQASDLDRKINALIPALYVKTGTEESLSTFDNLVNRLTVLDADINNMKSWLSEQSYNFSAPIDYDKFINYSNYFWVGSQQPLPAPSWNPNLVPEYYVIQPISLTPNDWQTYNFWIHRDDLVAEGYNVNDAVQAVRPIIEYDGRLQLNSCYTVDGTPNDMVPGSYVQTKTRFNQLPQFDLYRYDGTHHGATSALFFYVEDPDFTVDAILKKRVKTTINSDYIFGIGNVDEQGRLLYYKLDGELTGTWKPGRDLPEPLSYAFNGAANKGDLVFLTTSITADNQDWKFTATSPTEFSAVGTRSGNVGTVTVDTEWSCDDFTITITSGTDPYVVGESFTFSMTGPMIPRYVKELPDGSIVNYPGGPEADGVDGVIDGTWLTPGRMFQNMERETRTEIAYGDLFNHFRSVIRHQDGFTGASFGINNFRTLGDTIDLGLGGTIREFSSNFQLLASLLIQKDVSPLSIIEFAEQQYNTALASVDQYLVNELANYLPKNAAFDTSIINPNSSGIIALANAYDAYRAANVVLSAAFSDTTANISNWPATLPMLGLAEAVTPTLTFDAELGLDMIVHHDGHVSPLATKDADFDRKLVSSLVLRSDGTTTAGVFSESSPTVPYAKQLWMKPSILQVSIFDVDYDTIAAPKSGTTGQFWFNPSNGELREMDTTGVWVVSSQMPIDRWMILDTATLRNSLILNIEQRLFLSVHPSQLVKVNLDAMRTSDYQPLELARFAAKYGYDMFAPNYDATDAFTWNYKQSVIPGISGTTPAAWFDVYKTYFNIPGVSLPTCRPNLEPWKLLNYADKPPTWDADWADGGVAPNWLPTMWAHIQSLRPTLKLCVDTSTNELLPPYVNASKLQSVNALLTTIPTGISAAYVYGDNGPVEIVWRKSLEFLYGEARSYFRTAPLPFLDATWGETYIKVGDNLRVERNLMTSLPASKFLLHGEKLNISNQYSSDEVMARVNGTISSSTANEVVFEVSHVENNLTVFYVNVNGVRIGMINEMDSIASLTIQGVTFTDVFIDDLGIPFELGDKLVVNTVVGGPNIYTHIPAPGKKFNGLCQWFTNLLRFNYVDTEVSPSINAFKNWNLKLAYRTGTLIRQDSIDIQTALGTVPTTGFNLVLKKSIDTESKWFSAIRVQLVEMGSSVLAPSGFYIPKTDASDWIFRVETYNTQHPQLERYVVDTNGAYQTFYALDAKSTSIPWKRYTSDTAIETVTMPKIITGLQNVLDFLYGYINRLEALGWKINEADTPEVDPVTGKTITWQHDIEKLIDTIYTGMSTGAGFILNPNLNKITLQTPVGLMSKYTEAQFIDSYSNQALFDVISSPILIKNVSVVRTDDSTVTYSTVPIYSAHVFIDEYEHAIMFNKKFSDETNAYTVFDPFLGISTESMYLSYVKQDSSSMKPTFDGFFLNGNHVSRNITSSIDNMSSYYNAVDSFGEETTAQHALALLGFKNKDYFDGLQINKTAQFNFWRGIIQAKGTNMTIDAFTNYKKFEDSSVDEFWAYKLAEYGDAREKRFPEIKLNAIDATQKFTRLQFYSADDANYSAIPLFTQIESSDDSRWYSIDDLGKGLSFETEKISETFTIPVDTVFPAYFKLQNIYHTGDNFDPTVDGPSAYAKIVGANTLYVDTGYWGDTYTITGYTWINPSKLSPVKLFDYQEKTLVEEIGLWHPAIGIHTALALEIVNMVSKNDPAQYSYSTKTIDNPNYRKVKSWGQREVGRVWWDTSNLGYIPYYDSTFFPSRTARNSRWGSLAEWASIDLYEWTESSVHPSAYDALAATQEGSAAIDNSVKLSGKAAGKKIYSRNRTIKMRPIAWSKAGVGDANAHPAFGPAEFTTVYVSGNSLIADSGRVASINLINGRNFAGWLNGKPVGEVSIGTSIAYTIGSYREGINNPILHSKLPAKISHIAVRAIENGKIGARIGNISIVKKDVSTTSFAVRLVDSDGVYEDVILSDWYANVPSVETTTVVSFEKFGIEFILTRNPTLTAKTIVASDLALSMTSAANDLYIREMVDFTTIIPLPDAIFVNDTEDPLFIDYEWRTWEVPTQVLLNSDLATPYNQWQPYLGDVVEVAATPDVVQQMASSSSSYVLKSGITVNRYTSTWSAWSELSNFKSEAFSNGVDAVSFTLSNAIEAVRLSIYANGIQVNPSNYTIIGATVTLANVLQEGTLVLLLYRAYQPTADELAFDPDVKDDPTLQIQYKADYQYTVMDTRDSNGNITGAKYYFWVQNKSVPRVNTSMSLVEAKNLLKNGPSVFMMFERQVAGSTNPVYDSCTFSGLNSLVTKNDAFKLRFLRDFTLRDDPEEMQLKNTHTEWALMCKGQTYKIPSTLWAKLTDAAAGEDIGGKPVPSQTRIDYDARNGTRVRFGFNPGQIFAETELVATSITNAILNTQLTIRVAGKKIPDYITCLDFTQSDSWFATPDQARATMNTIWANAKPKQINEIFFSVLEDALANNYEFSDIFKTSLITVNTTTQIVMPTEQEQLDGQF